MRLIGSYFELTDRLPSRSGAPATGAAARIRRAGEYGESDESGDRKEVRLLISVAKRLVRSAVRRNTVKRIVREAWRAAVREAAGAGGGTQQSTPRGTGIGIAQQGVQGSLQQDRGSAGGDSRVDEAATALRPPARVCLVRLKRYPGPGLVMIKRSLRGDVDQLFAAFLAGRPGRRGPVSRAGVLPPAAPGRGALPAAPTPGSR